ncbi:hypothetical protein [Novosphingobium sp. PASSN1]|uniref:hypothetical protein n=1 Tax=Novosphingobium sp. PASSN1 TaxID=2015561 RepID=UPI000BCCE0B2|nr:hypothetical protein [Novosphingobium sp. PASSN1]OYU35173.1 MAG: hypothetical protein CFE35_12185 [Novosphingobium sp. PASSN1]
MAFRELAYQAKALAALEAWLERLAEERAEVDDYIAFQQSRGRPVGNLPDFPTKAWERLAADKGVPGGRAYGQSR